MYIKTGKACGYWYAVAYKDESENERLHRVEYTNAAMQMEWMDAPAGSDMEKQIERKGENFALQQLLDEMVEREQISVADALAEMAKFMGGEVEREDYPEPEKPKLAYAEGDKVLVYGEIVRVDEDDAEYPYRVWVNNVGADWVYPSDIAGKVEPDVKEEPKPEPVKYETGTKVRSKAHPEWGVGEYDRYWKIGGVDKHPHRVQFEGRGAFNWLADNDIEVVTEEPKPEPKFKVGDKVIHKFKPEWGVGSVTRIREANHVDIEYAYSGVRNVPVSHLIVPATFKIGDKVIHKFKPEWGVGEVVSILADTYREVDYVEYGSEETGEFTGRFYKVRYARKGDWYIVEQNLVSA